MSNSELEERIRKEIRDVDDWISLADALKLIGTSSFLAGNDDVRRILECVDRSRILRLGRIVHRFEAIAKPISVMHMVERLMAPDNPADRSGLMMELFIIEDSND